MINLSRRLDIGAYIRFCSIIACILYQSCAFTAGVVTENELKKMTAAQALSRLQEGATRFEKNQQKRYNLREQRYYLGKNGSFPPVVVLAGTDARTAPEIIFNQGLGDLFTLRSPASMVTFENVAAMEVACYKDNAKVIVLLAQTRDPYIEKAVENNQTGNLPAINILLRPAIEHVQRDPQWKRMKKEDFLYLVLREHIMLSLQKITAISPILRGMIEKGQVVLVAAIYNVESGKTTFLNADL